MRCCRGGFSKFLARRKETEPTLCQGNYVKHRMAGFSEVLDQRFPTFYMEEPLRQGWGTCGLKATCGLLGP
jgi:hypothetical protein